MWINKELRKENLRLKTMFKILLKENEGCYLPDINVNCPEGYFPGRGDDCIKCMFKYFQKEADKVLNDISST